MNKLLIVGCGELGSRFLQAACATNEFSIIEIVEPNNYAIDIAKQRVFEILNSESKVKLVFLNNFTQISSCGDIAIIATQADTREEVFIEVVKLGYKLIIIEKIVTQSIIQYQNMLELATLNNVKVWVNCKTRCYPIWKYIKSKINKNDNLKMYSMGGNHGLCTNGIHTIDLFIFLSEVDELFVKNINIDNEIIKTKRNKYDTSGSLSLYKNNKTISLEYEKNHLQMPIEIVITDNYKWIIDNSTKQAFEICFKEENKYFEIPYEGDLSVSFMSKLFLIDILKYSKCELPTLDDCFLAHKIIFETMLPYFKKHINPDSNLCPIT